jgi:cytochrome c oxidase assembly factor CtaG
MPPVAEAVLQSWSFPPYVTAINVLTVLMYFRGWRVMHAAMPYRFTLWRLCSFLGGIAALEIALASPIDTFDPFLLSNHMFQHMMLMMLVPPLILLSDPAIPMLHGMPLWASREVLGPVLSWKPVQRLAQWLTQPALCWLFMALAMLGWHVPAAYELALRSPGWHEVEHVCFLVASLLFWWPVIQPWPSRAQWPRWTMPLYLLLADFVNSALSAFLTFSDHVLYHWYTSMPRLGGISAQSDQVAAGVSMWVIGSFAYLIPAVAITAGLLSPTPPAIERERRPALPETAFARAVFSVLMLALPLAAIAYGEILPDSIDTDGAMVRMQGISGPFRVSVFTAPGLLDAGPTDVSVLVQDRDSGEAILDAAVDLAMKAADGGSLHPSVRATRRKSANKLLEAATIDLPAPGSWNLSVVVRRGNTEATLSSQLDVASTGKNDGMRSFFP